MRSGAWIRHALSTVRPGPEESFSEKLSECSDRQTAPARAIRAPPSGGGHNEGRLTRQSAVSLPRTLTDTLAGRAVVGIVAE